LEETSTALDDRWIEMTQRAVDVPQSVMPWSDENTKAVFPSCE